MRLEKTTAVLKLARALASNWEGLTLDEMADFLGVGRRTAERMRDAVEEVFGLLDHADDGRKKRFNIAARGLDRFVTTPTIDELTELENAARALEAAQAPDRAAQLHSLRDKIETSLRDDDRRVLSRNVEDQIRAETFACQVGPRPMSDPSVLLALREALLAGSVVRFNYGGDDGEPPRWRKVVPYGLLFGPRYYLVASVKSRPGAGTFSARYDPQREGDRRARLAARGLRSQSLCGAFLRRVSGRARGRGVALRSFGGARRPRLSVPSDAELRGRADGSLTVRFHAGGLMQIAHHLMTWGPAVTIVAPPELQERCASRSRRCKRIMWRLSRRPARNAAHRHGIRANRRRETSR